MWLVGLGVWFSLWVREVPGSNPGQARFFFSLFLFSFSFLLFVPLPSANILPDFRTVFFNFVLFYHHIFSLQPYLIKPWRKLFYSDASCSIVQVCTIYWFRCVASQCSLKNLKTVWMNAVIAYMMVALTLKADGCVGAAFFAGWNNRQLYPKMLTLTSSSIVHHIAVQWIWICYMLMHATKIGRWDWH